MEEEDEDDEEVAAGVCSTGQGLLGMLFGTILGMAGSHSLSGVSAWVGLLPGTSVGSALGVYAAITAAKDRQNARLLLVLPPSSLLSGSVCGWAISWAFLAEGDSVTPFLCLCMAGAESWACVMAATLERWFRRREIWGRKKQYEDYEYELQGGGEAAAVLLAASRSKQRV